MKKFSLCLFFLASLFPLSNLFAQANVQSTGISIQGIARDENNSALANIDALGLVFKIYYLDGSNNEVTILNQTANVKTDNFGVFSYVMSIDNSLFTAISNSQAYLKVSQGAVVFSNEKLQAVPYAIQAQNGVPTGTIMAYVGTTAPAGWLLCDGAAIPDNVYHAKLRTLLGSANSPDLRGMFLRGAGSGNLSNSNGVTRPGPNAKQVQTDSYAEHNHAINLTTSTNGNHNHDNGAFNSLLLEQTNNGNSNTPTGFDRSDWEAQIRNNARMVAAGNHNHVVQGNSGNAGASETRPINYGVNYIIKI
jgi:microcystin-dependent protein